MFFSQFERVSFLAQLGVFSVAVACTGEPVSSTNKPVEDGEKPVADAGSGGTYSSDEPIFLNGDSSFDPDAVEGDALNFHWSFTRVPTGSNLAVTDGVFQNNDSTNPETSFIADTAGIYIIELVVTDADGMTSNPDSVIVTVEEGALPIASAGPDQNVMEDTLVTLDGSASADPLNRALTYTWSLEEKPANSTLTAVDSPATQVSSFTPDVPGRYLVSLIVHNGVSGSLPDLAIINVESANPLAPIADAGEDIEGSDCSNIQLDGSASSDPNEDILEYLWTVQSVPSTSAANDASISDRSLVNPTFYPDVAGEYVLSLAVFDGTSWSIPDLVTINAVERISNGLPSVSAGANITGDAGNGDCILSGYGYECAACDDISLMIGSDASAVDPDGDAVTYEWYVMSGNATVLEPYSAETTVTLSGATTSGVGSCDTTTYELELVATDCPGAQAADGVSISVTCCGVEVTGQ